MKRSEALTTSSSVYTNDRLITALHAKGWSDELQAFNWHGLGMKVSVLSRSPPEINFLCGAIDKPEKTKKAREKKAKPQDDEEVETQFEEVNEQPEEKEDEATTRRADEMNKVFAARQAEAQAAHGDRSGEASMDLFPLLDNPQSFHQTVENFFDFSFRIKQ